MDHRELKRLVQLMNDNELIELEIEKEGLRVSLRKAGAGVPVPAAPPSYAPVFPPPAAPGETPPVDAPAGGPAEEAGTRLIASPMVGTFYRRPSPDSDPYVEVGHTVDPETVVCIVEAMKVNNEIKAEAGGTVVEIFVEDGEPVEFDQPLFRIRT